MTDAPQQSGHAPLVSVLCRTTGRDTLGQALRSVAQQTWRPLEIILVEVTGEPLNVEPPADDIALRRVRPEAPLSRPEAANAALEAAQGDLLLFLDDDDWITPSHIANLVRLADAHPDTGVFYSSTVKTTPDGEPTDEVFRTDFSAARLRHDNFIPIHAALFRRELLRHGVRFDERLDIFEDWDFWLQLAAHTDFLHHDEITACYRGGGESETAARHAADRYRHDTAQGKGREALFSKWLPEWTGQDYNEALGDLDDTPERERLGHELSELHGRCGELQREKDSLQQRLRKREAEAQEARRHVRHLEDELQRIYHSVSWKLTRPYRWLRRRLTFVRPAAPVTTPGARPALWENGIACALDCPSEAEQEFAESLVINGWCLSRGGIASIRCQVDDDESGAVEFVPDVQRPDLEAEHPGYQQEQPAGFRRTLDLSAVEPGEHRLTLTLTASDGRQRQVTTAFFRMADADRYNDWYWRTVPEPEPLQAACRQLPERSADDRLQVIVVAGARDTGLDRTLASLGRQCEANWELHLVALTRHTARQVASDRAIGTLSGEHRLHVHENIASALEAAAGRWTTVLEAGEQLAPQALLEWQVAAAGCDITTLIYSDHDRVEEDNRHCKPCFTPEWSPDHVLAANPVGDVFLFRTTGPEDVPEGPEALPAHCQPAWRYHLLLERAAGAPRIQRIPRVLWSRPVNPEADEQLRMTAETGVVEHWLSEETGETIPVQPDAHGIRRVIHPLEHQPRISIIIPTTGKPEIVRPCMESLLEHTRWPDYEVIVLDNGRGAHPDGIEWLRERVDRVIECHEPFNWARLNNIGAAAASGELLLFLNDDIEITQPDWLDELARQALRPEIGTVGARLYYPNGWLQHCGVMLVNYGGGGIHLLHRADPAAPIYRRLHDTQREVSANTGACLMVSREKYEAVDGFEEALPVVGNDVDFCLRLADRGWRSIWTPYCSLVHHESISRRNSVPPEDEQTMWKRWRDRFLAGDPYYNPNLCEHRCDFSLRTDRVYGLPVSGSGTAAPMENRTGVNLIGFIRAAMGIGEGARSDARALDAVQEPFTIINHESGNPARMTDTTWRHRESDNAPFDVTLLHINPDHAAQAVAELPDRCFEGKYVIGYWAWELPEMPEEWKESFRLVDEVWVPSRFCQDAIGMESPVPVVTIPHCVDVRIESTPRREDFGLPGDRFLFLTMFDVNSRPERKNPFGAIRAFCQAFDGSGDEAALVIKLNNPTPEALRALHDETGERDDIIILDGVYSRERINALIACTDCFVSLHRSEGFGLGPAEAMSLGKVAMITRWSGNTDYMTPDNCIGIDYELVTLTADHGPYRAGQHWAEPDLEQAALDMGLLASDPERAAEIGAAARRTMREHFSPRAVGRQMQRRLTAIRNHRR